MGELAPKSHHDPQFESVDRQFELIHTHFDRDPNSHLFSALWDFEIDIADLTHRRNPTDKERNEALKTGNHEVLRQYRPVITSGNQLLTDIFIQIEFMHPPERLKEFEAGRNELLHAAASDNSESNNYMYQTLDKLVTLHKVVRSRLNEATDTYYSEEYWEDPAHKRGLKTDQIERLYDYTEQYEDLGLLKALDKIDESRAFSQDIMFEAKRIARIMVARENNRIL